MPYNATLIDSRNNELDLIIPNVRLQQIDGLGMPDVGSQSERYANQDGDTWLASWLQRRVVNLGFLLVNDTESAMWDARLALLEVVKVLSAGFRLRLDLPNGDARQIDLRYDSALTMGRDLDQGDKHQRCVVTAIAHDPLFYDPTSVVWAYVVSGGSGSWIFPLAFPSGFGASFVDQVETMTYTGTWKTYPVITITGPVDDLIITNETTGEVLDFTGYALGAAETLTIDLRPGYKTVTHSVDGNVPDALTDDSDLGTWHIAAHPEAVHGLNTIALTGTGANINTRIEIRFYPRFIGV